MTLYSLLNQGPRTTVLATWPANFADVSIKVTSLADRGLASHLAQGLSALSEAAWFSAAWLDTWTRTQSHLEALVHWLRDPGPAGPVPAPDFTRCRNADTASSIDVEECFELFLEGTLPHLTHPQRLALAEELEADLAAIREALDVHSRGLEPEPDARGWQLLRPTRTFAYGMEDYLPDGAPWIAGVLMEAWLPSELWAARGHFMRLDQLAAAATKAGGEGWVGTDPIEAKLRFPLVGSSGDHRMFTVRPAFLPNSNLHQSTREPMTVDVTESLTSPHELIGHLDPLDTAGFAALMGDWVYGVELQ